MRDLYVGISGTVGGDNAENRRFRVVTEAAMIRAWRLPQYRSSQALTGADTGSGAVRWWEIDCPVVPSAVLWEVIWH
jgi:hypothetical protein